MKKVIFLVFFVLLYAKLIPTQAIAYLNYLPQIEKAENSVFIKFSTVNRQSVYYLYYRTEGVKKFQIRKMGPGEDGQISIQLPVENLYGKNIEYFIMEEKANHRSSISPTYTIAGFTRKESPDLYFVDSQPASSETAKKDPLLNFNGSISTSRQIYDEENKEDYYTANGNFRAYKNINKPEYQLDIDTNFTHMDPRKKEEPYREGLINLTNMIVRFKKNIHQLEMGDLSINQSEFTASGLNRRGLRYAMTGKKMFFNTFWTNAEQKTKFDGFGIPPSSASIFGAVAGIDLNQKFKIQGLFMTGKDNLDSLTVASVENPFRDGNMFSIQSDLNLFKNHFQLLGEWAESQFGSAATAETASQNRKSDTAWRAVTNFNYGAISFNTDYKKIGSQFNSIANLFLQNDREGLTSNLMCTIKTFSWGVNYLDQKNYLTSTIQPMLHQKRIGTNLNWVIGTHWRVGGEFSRDNLDYDQSTGLQTGGSDMNTLNYSSTFGYMSGSNGVTLTLGKTESQTFTSNFSGSVAFNLKFGQILSLGPTYSYQNNKNLTDNSTSKIQNVYFNSELMFIPQLFSLTLSGSYMINDNQGNRSTNGSVNANLNFFAAKLFKSKIQPALALKYKYLMSKFGETETHASALFLQLDIAI